MYYYPYYKESNMFFKSYKQFKDSFNSLFKKYHPDNQETGDAEMFMKYKQVYDDTINSGLLDKIINNEVIDITTTQAFEGCIIHCQNFDLKIPPKFYNKKKRLEVMDKNGVVYKIYVNIVPEDDETIYYDKRFADLIVTKIVHVNALDIILGCRKTLKVFGKDVTINLKPYEVLKSKKEIPNMGYPQRYNIDKRNPLRVQFMIDNIELTNEDIQVLQQMREKYER